MKKWRHGFIAAALALLIAGAVLAADRPFTARLAVKVYEGFVTMKGFKPDELSVRSIGHSHIDAAWKWRMDETHGKVLRTFQQAVDNMEKRPDFTFSQSQPALYEWMLDEHPDLFARMVAMEKAGRWEITGGMWVEPDCNMPEGESFVRQRLLGQGFYLEHFGHIAEIGWLPDSFGYNLNLPQIYARSGAKYLWAKKINTNQETVFPFQNFVWRSPDGSEVLTTLNSMSVGLGFFCYQEIGKFKQGRYLFRPGVELLADYSMTPDEIKASLSDDWMNEIANFYGEGDGDQGPTYIEVEIQEALRDKGYTRFTNARSYFDDLENYRDRLAVWTEELYLERHRGTLTTQAWIKRANRLAESMLRSAEGLTSFLKAYGKAYPGQALTAIWKLVCLHQFHDILPGSSIPEVYEDARPQYEKVRTATRELIDGGLDVLAGMADTRPPKAGLSPLVVFNPLGWERSGPVEVGLEEDEDYIAMGPKGEALVSQVVSDDSGRRLLFRAEDVPPLGFRVYHLGKGRPAAAGGLKISGSGREIVLANDLVRVSVDRSSGHITSLVDLSTGREMVKGSANRILAFHERAKSHRVWDINPDYLKHPIELPDMAAVEVTAEGPLFVEVKATREVVKNGRTTVFVQRVRVFEGDPMIYLDLDSRFNIEDSLVKVEFNTTVNTDRVAADGPYLVVERPTHPRTDAEKARWELACQKWIDLSDAVGGLALINNGKYGFSLNPEGTGFRLSVIKGAEYPMPYSDAVNVNHPKEKDLPYTDQGEHHIEMGLLAHAGGWREARLWEAGYEFNSPLEAVRAGSHGGVLGKEAGLVSLESDSAYIGWVKGAEDGDGLVIRVIEAAGRGGTVRLLPGAGLKFGRAMETDLLEMNLQPIQSSSRGITIELGPYQVRTIKARLSK